MGIANHNMSRSTTLTGLVFLLFAASANVSAATWTFQNTEFADGAMTLEGTFDYDATTNVYSNLDLTTAGAINVMPNNPRPNSSATYLGAVQGSGNLNGAPLLQLYFDAPLTAAGGQIPLILMAFSSYGSCGDPDCLSAFPLIFATSGQVVSAAVPLPPTACLILPALAILKRKRPSR